MKISNDMLKPIDTAVKRMMLVVFIVVLYDLFHTVLNSVDMSRDWKISTATTILIAIMSLNINLVNEVVI